jgi:hypothetical protein
MRAASLYLNLLLAAPAILIGACASRPIKPESQELRVQREHAFQATWRGQSYNMLVEEYGNPILSMEIPGRPPHATFVAVYGEQDPKSKCVDAFTIIVVGGDKEDTVMDYFCR